VNEKVVLVIVSLAIPAAALLALLATTRGDRFQFNLRTILLWFVPMAAVMIWVLTWDGPLASNRRVVTHKTGLLMLLLNANVAIAAWRRGWIAWRAMLIALCLFALLFVRVVWNQHEEFDSQRTRNDLPSSLPQQ
jgi:hypothetical protein